MRMSNALRRCIAPGIRYHQDTFVDVLADLVPQGGDWLDLGCGHQLLPGWRADEAPRLTGRARRIFGLDCDLDSLRRHRTIRFRSRADIGALPFADDSFDLVTANMVVEHLSDPTTQFREIARVLRAGGTFLFHTPNTSNYQVQLGRLLPDRVKTALAGVLEGRRAEDVYPTFYRANDTASIAACAAEAGLDVARLDHVSSYPGLGLVPPLALVELCWIRVLERPSLAAYRHNIIGALRKPAALRLEPWTTPQVRRADR